MITADERSFAMRKSLSFSLFEKSSRVHQFMECVET